MGIASVSSLSANFSVKSGGITPLSYWVQGAGTAGARGDNSTVTRSSPVQITYGTPVASYDDVFMFGYQALGILKSNRTLWVWGNNLDGQLGLGDRINRSSPVQVAAGKSWSIVKGNQSVTAIDIDNKLWVWGDNANGQLGLGDTLSRSAPVQLGTDNWKWADSSGSHTMAIKSDGTLWLWGVNVFGQLLNNLRTSRSSPVQLGTASNWVKTAGNGTSTMLLNSLGELWGGGYGAYGEPGQGDTINRSSPVQVAGTWIDIVKSGPAAAYYAALDINNSAYLWGRDPNNGNLGLGSTASRSTPTQIPGKVFKKMILGSGTTFGITPNNELWAWGLNNQGQYGIANNVTNRSSPVLVNTNTINAILALQTSVHLRLNI